MMVDRWERRLETKPARTSMWLIVGCIVFVLAIVAGIWVVRAVTSPVRGAGDAYAAKNGAGNFIEAQHAFVADLNDYTAAKSKIADARKTLAAESTQPAPTDGLAAYEHQRQITADSATVTQLIQGCQDTAARYNTNAQSYLLQDFRGANLPDRLDPAACSAN